MAQETKDIVTIESYTRTVIRRSRCTVELVPEAVLLLPPATPAVQAASWSFIATTRAFCRRLRQRLRRAQEPE